MIIITMNLSHAIQKFRSEIDPALRNEGRHEKKTNTF